MDIVDILWLGVSAIALGYVIWAVVQATKMRNRVNAHIEALEKTASELEARVNRAYSERNALAIGFAKMAKLAGFDAGHGLDDCPEKGWDPEWLHVVYVDLPDGRQVSWHMGPDMVERASALGEYGKPWDGTMHGRDLSWCEFEMFPQKWSWHTEEPK